MIPGYMDGWIDQVNHHPVQTGTGVSYGGLHAGSGFTSPLSPDCNNSPPFAGCCMPSNSFGNQYPRDYQLGNDNSYAYIYAIETNTYYNTNIRTYLIGLFTNNLIAGEQYEVSFHASYADQTGHTFNDLGAYLDAYHPNWNTSPFV